MDESPRGGRRTGAQDISRGVTLVELVLVMVLIGLLAIAGPSLMRQGVQTMVFLPRATSVNHVAAEVASQMVEGGISALPGQSPIAGLRFATHNGTQPAIRCARPNAIRYRTPDHRCVHLLLFAGVVVRSVWSVSTTQSCGVVTGVSLEFIPYEAPGTVQIIAPGGLFQYYNQAGAQLGLNGCGGAIGASVRRVDIAFEARTGSGLFEEGHAREAIVTAVAIRNP